MLAEDALKVLAGYAIGLDMTVRGPEVRSLRESLDTYSVPGSWLVTADEILDPGNLDFPLSVNGELRQSARTSDRPSSDAPPPKAAAPIRCRSCSRRVASGSSTRIKRWPTDLDVEGRTCARSSGRSTRRSPPSLSVNLRLCAIREPQ